MAVLYIYKTGADPGFQVAGGGGCALEKKCAERGEARKCLGYFVWKITILRQKIIFFPILGGARAGCAPPPLDPPLRSPLASVLMTFFFEGTQLFTWDGVDGFKIYESFSDSDKLLKIWFSLFKMFKKEDLNSEFTVICKRKCFSSSIHLQCEHKRCSLEIFKCLLFSINRLCSLILSFVISFLYSKLNK
jgi:hypothetical protein